MKKKKIIISTILIIIGIIIILWISGIIPKQIAKISTTIYFKNNFPKKQYEYVDIEWASAYGDYIITFKDNNNDLYGVHIGPKYFPINIGQGSFALEEQYRIEYGSGIQDINDFYNHSIASQYTDIRQLPQNYSKEQAQNDNCFIIESIDHNNNLYTNIMEKYNKKENAFIRIVNFTIEGDMCITDILYDANNDKIHLVIDNTRDKFSAQNDRIIEYKVYEKLGIFEYNNSQYFIAYNGELPDKTNIKSDALFIIATIT